jgi:hypothetical protein
MSRVPDLIRKTEVERFFNRLETYLDRFDGYFGTPARIITDNSNMFVNVKYFQAFIEKAIEASYALPRGDKTPDAP